MASAGKDVGQELQELTDKERRLRARSSALESERAEAQRMLSEVDEP